MKEQPKYESSIANSSSMKLKTKKSSTKPNSKQLFSTIKAFNQADINSTISKKNKVKAQNSEKTKLSV